LKRNLRVFVSFIAGLLFDDQEQPWRFGSAIFTLVIFSLILISLPSRGSDAAKRPIIVASKNFSESYLLSEMLSQLLESEGYEVERKFGLGGTLVCYEALKNGEIDVYPEYSGTLSRVILKVDDAAPSVERLNQLLVNAPMSVLDSFGFNNTYAIALKESLAIELQLTKVSQLAAHQNLRVAFGLEFLNRADGWPGLSALYALSQEPIGIEHGLAYQAIDDGKVDVTEAYSTDGDLARYKLTTLIDDRKYFPQYIGLPFVRNELSIQVKLILNRLSGKFDDALMRELNAQVVVEGKTFSTVANEYLVAQNLTTAISDDDGMLSFLPDSLLENTLTHLKLTSIALALGCLVGFPLGILVFRSRTLSRVVVYVAGLMQTVPSIALLALMIPLFGIGQVPAIIALFMYSLLPILRNTITALLTINPLLKSIAEAIGLTRFQQLRYVLVPMAAPTILAGVKTAAVISIGTATLAAFIGAGGLGEPIVTGLALNSTELILQGAIPAAGLAILVELLFEGIEKLLVKPHMLQNQLPE
jgi:osmoprotectant transport system permease protein